MKSPACFPIRRLRGALFALRRYVPASAQNVLKPFYRRWRQTVLQKQLSRAVAECADGWPTPGDFGAVRVGQISEPCGRTVIVIVSYQSLDCLRLCLESIWARTDCPGFSVIVVDNASDSGVINYLRNEQTVRRSLTVIFNDENVGFARANNIGLAAAGECDHVVFLNNDTVVTSGWLSGLIRHLRSDPGIGMIGPLTNWANNETRVATDYSSMREMEAFARGCARNNAGQVSEVATLAMFCVALRRSVVNQIGVLDESFGLGMFEDDDYAVRLRRAGYRLVYARDVFVHHWGWASFGHMPQAEYDRLFDANRLRFEAKWGEPWRRPPITFGQL